VGCSVTSSSGFPVAGLDRRRETGVPVDPFSRKVKRAAPVVEQASQRQTLGEEMIKDETVRRSPPGQRNRESLLERILLTAGFTAAQVWAAVTLAGLGLSGWAVCSLVLVLAAAFIAVLDAWREIWSLFRAAVRHSSRDSGEGSGVVVGE
jgi:hypothetical protein